MEVGVDIVKIDRFKNMIEKDLSKHFTKNEILYITSKGKNRLQSLAGIFSCKESVLKALGLGIFSNKLSMLDIEISHIESRPIVVITPKLFHYIDKIGCGDIKVSISHDGEYAISECIIY